MKKKIFISSSYRSNGSIHDSMLQQTGRDGTGD